MNENSARQDASFLNIYVYFAEFWILKKADIQENRLFRNVLLQKNAANTMDSEENKPVSAGGIGY